MGTKTIWICDMCKREVEFDRLALRIQVEYMSTSVGFGNRADTVLVCKACRDRVLGALAISQNKP